MGFQGCVASFLLVGYAGASKSRDALSSKLASEISALLEGTGSAFERHYHHTVREVPLLPINLNDVEAWLDLGPIVGADDVEMFAVPPAEQFGKGGDFQSSPRPVPIEGRLKNVRKHFGKGRSFVINSLHRWCPKAAKLASLLREKVGLPVDVYMYLTPPFSHSYGLHADVMDAFMVQLVGSKMWQACDRDGKNCTTLESKNGDIVYLPMGAKHAAWTSQDLSAHLTVNVERQFYVWGSIFVAMAKRFLLPDTTPALDKLRDMRPFGIEEESDPVMVPIMNELSSRVPSLMRMPEAVSNFTLYGQKLTGEAFENGWANLLNELMGVGVKKKNVRLSMGKKKMRTFPSFIEILHELVKVDKSTVRSGFDWLARLISRSVDDMHREHSRDSDPKEFPIREKQKLGSLAEARAQRIGHTGSEL